MQYPANFNKELFTQEELTKIGDLVDKGLHKLITSVLSSDIDQVKEYHLQLLLNSVEPQFSGFEDKVRTGLDQLKRDGIDLESPQQEAAVEKLIKEEAQLIKQKNSLLNAKRELEISLSAKKEENVDVVAKIKEIVGLISELDKKYKSSFEKDDVKKALMDNKAEDIVIKTVEKPKEELKKESEVVKTEAAPVTDKVENTPTTEVEKTVEVKEPVVPAPEDEKLDNTGLIEFTEEEVRAKLDEKGIEYDKRLGVKKLLKLLE